MSDVSGVRSALLPKVAELNAQASAPSSETKAKIQKSGHDFESILLNNWLQGAYSSFGTVPGGDDEDADGGKEQYQAIGVQALSAAMTATGGIGISRMITDQLTKTVERQQNTQHAAQPDAEEITNKK